MACAVPLQKVGGGKQVLCQPKVSALVSRDSILTGPRTLTLIEHPVVSSEGGVEPHGVVQGDHEVHLMPVLVGQQRCAQESIVRDIGSHTAVHLDVALPCKRSQPHQPWAPGLYSSGPAGRWGRKGLPCTDVQAVHCMQTPGPKCACDGA